MSILLAASPREEPGPYSMEARSALRNKRFSMASQQDMVSPANVDLHTRELALDFQSNRLKFARWPLAAPRLAANTTWAS